MDGSYINYSKWIQYIDGKVPIDNYYIDYILHISLRKSVCMYMHSIM